MERAEAREEGGEGEGRRRKKKKYARRKAWYVRLCRAASAGINIIYVIPGYPAYRPTSLAFYFHLCFYLYFTLTSFFKFRIDRDTRSGN